VVRFYTALDIAQDEYLAHRLSSDDFIEVGRELLAADSEMLYPEYVALPYASIPNGVLSKLFQNDPSGDEMRTVRKDLDRRSKRIHRARYENPGWLKYHMIYR
jgi:hypothetical protein